jgi:hypothetical protein
VTAEGRTNLSQQQWPPLQHVPTEQSYEFEQASPI